MNPSALSEQRCEVRVVPRGVFAQRGLDGGLREFSPSSSPSQQGTGLIRITWSGVTVPIRVTRIGVGAPEQLEDRGIVAPAR